MQLKSWNANSVAQISIDYVNPQLRANLRFHLFPLIPNKPGKWILLNVRYKNNLYITIFYQWSTICIFSYENAIFKSTGKCLIANYFIKQDFVDTLRKTCFVIRKLCHNERGTTKLLRETKKKCSRMSNYVKMSENFVAFLCG